MEVKLGSDAELHAQAKLVYDECQAIDEWAGSDYEGTSVLAGAKVMKRLGHLQEYRWAGAGSGSALEDLALAVGHAGPAVAGLDWHWDMFEPDASGVIHPTGEVAGGHAIMVHGVSRRTRMFRLHNSWGPSWGVNGGCFISFEDMDELLQRGGEACIPVGRTKVSS